MTEPAGSIILVSRGLRNCDLSAEDSKGCILHVCAMHLRSWRVSVSCHLRLDHLDENGSFINNEVTAAWPENMTFFTKYFAPRKSIKVKV